MATQLARLEVQETPVTQTFDPLEDYSAPADGASHPLDTWFSSLAQAQTDYPWLTAAHWPDAEMDWLAWQAAIDAAEAVRGRVHARYGDYLINFALRNDASGVIIEGDGYGTRLIAQNDPTGAAIDEILRLQHSDPTQQLQGWVVRDLNLDGNKAGSLCTRGLRAVTTHVNVPAKGRIEGVWAHDVHGTFGTNEGAGIVVICSPAAPAGTLYYHDIAMRDCMTYDCGSTYGYGLGVNAIRGVTLAGCHSWGNQSQGFGLWKASNVAFAGCESYRNYGNQYSLESADHVTLTGCLGDSDTAPSRYSTLKVYTSEYVTATGCQFRLHSNEWDSQTVYIFGGATTSSQWNRPSKHVLLEDCIIEKTGGNGRAIYLGANPTTGLCPSEDVQIRNCEILNKQTANVYNGIIGRALNVQITGNRIRGGIDLTGDGTSIEVSGNRIDAEFEAGTVRDVIHLKNYVNPQVNGNEVICDVAGANSVRAWLKFSTTSVWYAQVLGNRIRGRVDYIIMGPGGGLVCYPSAQGNHIGGLTVDTALLSGTTYPPAAGTWPTGATIWCDFNGSGNPSCYTWDGAAWQPGANW